MKNIHFKTCTCLLGILLILFSGIQVKGASLEVQQESKVSGTANQDTSFLTLSTHLQEYDLPLSPNSQ